MAEENATVALLKLCHPWSDYRSFLTVPSNLEDEIDSMRAQFCAIDIDALLQEAKMEFNLQVQHSSMAYDNCFNLLSFG